MPTPLPPSSLPVPLPPIQPHPHTISGFSSCLPPVRLKEPRPQDGPGSVSAFLESVTANDAVIEVLVGQGRILTTKVNLSVAGKAPALVAVGDPTVLDFVIVSGRQVRIIGLRIGVTDLSITTPDNQTYSFEVRVLADLPALRQQLACLFPDASLKLAQFRDHIVVEGQARDNAQVTRILETLRAYLLSVQVSQLRQVSGQQPLGLPEREGKPPARPPEGERPPLPVGGDGAVRSTQAAIAPPQVINLLKVPGPRQVLLKVRVAELNRTGFRQIGADLLGVNPPGEAVLGTNIAGSPLTANATAKGPPGLLEGFAELIEEAISLRMAHTGMSMPARPISSSMRVRASRGELA
jgi:pilus assembly protein CpaC